MKLVAVLLLAVSALSLDEEQFSSVPPVSSSQELNSSPIPNLVPSIQELDSSPIPKLVPSIQELNSSPIPNLVPSIQELNSSPIPKLVPSIQELDSSPIPYLVPSSSKKPEVVSKRLEQKQSEGRGFGRMEVSDAQLEMALKDKRYLQRQLKCTLGEAPCDPVGRRLRTLAPLVVRGSCPQCTPTEMRQIQKVLLHMQRNFPKEWARIVRTYQ